MCRRRELRVNVSQVTVCVSHGCPTNLSASPDGVWRATGLAGQLTSGPTDLSWSVDYTDSLGAEHLWSGPPILVAVDATQLPLSVVATRALKSLLFEVSPNDPTTFAIVTAFLVSAALAATYLPARRAARVEPADALRAH